MADRRFPPPWSVEESDVCDHNGRRLGDITTDCVCCPLTSLQPL
jgi:hypothetical protein